MQFGAHHVTAVLVAMGLLGLTAAPALAQKNPQKDAFFGQTHSHTSWSLDAYIIGNHITGPEEAYKFSLGQPIKHPAGFEVKLKHGGLDGSPKDRLANKVEAGMSVLKTSASGLGGVWAEENTREAIFAAMQRRETFGTSGVRVKVRLFGGWEFGPDVLKQKDWVKTGYAKGVPMGGDLPAPTGNAPTFVVWAVKDPEDGNLDRIQIVKGWTRNGQTFEKIYDVAWSGNRKRDPVTARLRRWAARWTSRPRRTRTRSAL
jgi:hypothetical protein